MLPQAAYSNIQTLLADYPQVYGPYGFYDALDPTTGAVGHRYLVLDQAMVLTALNNALEHGGLTRYFERDPVGKAVRPYLAVERFSIAPARP